MEKMFEAIGVVTGFVLGFMLAFWVIEDQTVNNDDYRALQVECGKAHYDSRTGEFVEGKE